MRILISFCFLLLCSNVFAFCGFYVGKADGKLFNEASKVIIARYANRTILTMANDYRGAIDEFALVVPIPYVFDESQIQISTPTILDRIDAYSAPRLVEYFDLNPCDMYPYLAGAPGPAGPVGAAGPAAPVGPQSSVALGVTVEAAFSVGEYDIVMLSAEQSDGLETWLLQNDYNIPEGAATVFHSYIDMGMKFFVAKVNLDELQESGNTYLNPIMMAFESEEFMLPIQLGTVNSAGKQDLLIFLLSPEGRVVTDNYELRDIPSDINLPEFIEDEFEDFYVTMFDKLQPQDARLRGAVFLEYAWDMRWCDPCAANPLTPQELQQAGVFWNIGANYGAPNVYLTRLHLNYSQSSHPEDLRFRVTSNRQNFQGRYILQRAVQEDLTCIEAEHYVESVLERQAEEAQRLAELTGWNIIEIREKIEPYQPRYNAEGQWWSTVFEQSN